ncbi:hypothetical protein GKZ90_0022595 [Flavobacterium sp. MC2016-06]|jgi:hypothetical protein|uniref:hypothetical protein n=1 Tax=Flavobacterium sp. MC2016-06 TaxID=2676308 RepID=UPI0012BAE3EB|nr:hypothetical protein [Flavobacterium sp. MC2016-06]MBU3861484.1 hypothetical protein [Flavobacterium sp. MC2016-06]
MNLGIDEYSIKARFYPSFIVLIPAIVLSIYYLTNFEQYYHYLTALSVAGLFTFILAQLGRDKGKVKEIQLFQYFGGKPTTQILRHRDAFLDKTTKKRYHFLLSQKLQLQMPTEIEENSDILNADGIYDSCAKYMISKTRDTNVYYLLFKENISYGFRRNLWGMKSWSISILIITLFIHLIFATTSFSEFSFSNSEIGLIVFLLFLLFFWIFIITRGWIKIAAFAYAERLFEGLNN